MTRIMELALLGMVIAPLAAAGAAFACGSRAPRLTGGLGAWAAGLGFLAAAAMTLSAAAGTVVHAAVGPAHFSADRLAVLLLLLVFGVSAIVQSFALRYLAGDPRAGWFAGGAGMLTAASAGLMTVDSLIGLAVFWTLAGIALCLLLATYRRLPAARDGLRRTVTALAIGDAALWTATILATATWGNVDLRSDQTGQFGGALLPVVAILVVLAALSRSAQIPFHRWLPATLAAPTPVSALLHAGVVNAGGVLLIRLAPLTADGAARALTIAAGVATMAYGALIMLVKPDVKGALVNSTTAQMGFMILTCGLGLWAAAVVHLVAHGFYKATLFLSSGSAVAVRRRHDLAPPAPELTGCQRVSAALAAVVLPVLALSAALAVVPLPVGDHGGGAVLLIFAAITAAAAVWGWMQRRPGATAAVMAGVLLIAAAIGYLALIEAVGGFLAAALPPAMLGAPAVWMSTAAAVLVLAVLGALRWAPSARRLRHMLYANALSAGHLPVRSAQLTGAR